MTQMSTGEAPDDSALWGFCDACARWYEVEFGGANHVVFYGCRYCHQPPAQLVRMTGGQRPD